MKITAKRIAQWATTKEAQAELPRLVRRLIYAHATATSIAVPSGDSTSQPGFDGEVHSDDGTAWVPKGHSVWEISCEAQATVKANKDFRKRLKGATTKVRKSRSYVALNARKWTTKKKWRDAKLKKKQWRSVRAYDADDLEAWLEQSPAVALQFGEELGLSGDGVESLSKCWSGWSAQTDPKISFEAFMKGRERLSEELVQKIRARLKDHSSEPLTIKSDSVEEAVAFVAGSLLQHEDLETKAVIINSASGWQFVDKNTDIKIAISARPEFAERPSNRAGLVVAIAYAAGDMGGHYKGVAGRLDGAELTIDRPDMDAFKKALESIGLDENDARRLSISTGRSWSVFRRRRANNPAIRRPQWLQHPSSKVLSTLCLLGGWSSAHDEDKAQISKLAGNDYPSIERDLRVLAKLWPAAGSVDGSLS